jgi:hypothetical protein
MEKRIEKKTRKTEIERLKEERRQKDQEIANLKDEQGVMREDDDEFNAGMTDIFHSSPRRSSPSPLDTVPNTHSKSAVKSSAEPGDGFVDGDIEIDDLLTQLVLLSRLLRLMLRMDGINADPTFLGRKLLFQASDGHSAILQLLLQRKDIYPN